jgi:aarF domain-containing kinase
VRKNLDRSNKREKFQIVLLDHGLYRDLSEEFRTNYCLLWKSLLFQNEKMLKESSENLGVGRFYKLFPLIFTFRHAKSSRSALIDAKMPEKEREQIVNDFKDSTVEDFNQFLQSVPRDMLLIFRTNALVRSLNFALGGSTASRLGVMFEFAMRGSYICHNDEMKASEKLSLFRKSKLWFDLLRLKMSLWIISLIEMSFKRSHNIQSKLVG